MPFFAFIVFVSITLTRTVAFNDSSNNRIEYYAHWMSLMSLFSDEQYYGFDLYDQQLFDIILPGSHHSGMYESAINTNLKPSTDSYFSAISFLNDSNTYVKWSIRQRGSIYDQLISGCRYLDIRLEKSGSEYYAHHGMLGASLTVMIEDITKFINIVGDELIIIHLSEFIGITQIDLDNIYYVIMSGLGQYMADSTSARYDITTDTMNHLIRSNAIQIIAFIDKSGLISTNGKNTSESERYDTFFFDANAYLIGDDDLHFKAKGKKGIEEDTEAEETLISTQTLISNALSQLTKGWDHLRKLNIVYWDVNIEHPLQINKYIPNYDSFLSVHNEFISTLKVSINYYPKVYFGNIVMIDFVEYLSIDEIMILIMNYNQCSDDTAYDCASLTKLTKSYKISGVSPICQVDDELQNICARSCGLCDEWLLGVPNAPCNNSLDCDGAIYKSAQALYTNDVNETSPLCANGFCLSPFAKESCGVLDFISGSIECTGSDHECMFSYDCSSGYCSSRDGICLMRETLPPTPYPTPIQCYCDHIESESAAQLVASVEPFLNKDEEYMEAVTAFGLVPIIIGCVLLGIYLCCCCLFCLYSGWSKYTFCRCFDGLNSKHCWFKWIFAVLLFTVLIIMTWQCIQGLQANSSMHNHLFDSSQPVTFRSEVVNMLDIATARFANVGDDTVWITSIMGSALGEVASIVERTNFDIDIHVDAIYRALTYIASEYDDFELRATVVDPQTMQPMEVVLECSFCEGIAETVVDINTSIAHAMDSVRDLELMVKQYSLLISHEFDLSAALTSFSSATVDFTSYIAAYHDAATQVMDVFEMLDEEREYVGRAIFVAPLFVVSLLCIALGAFALIAWISHCAFVSECCFKCIWCSMMFIGSLMMILFGALAIINIGWADFCVLLDEFERDPIESAPSSLLDAAKILNACWMGDNLFDTFNLSELQYWTHHQQNLSLKFNIDLFNAFDISQFDLFLSQIELIDIDEFHTQSDLYLNHLNEIGPPCTCNCLPWGTQQGAFTRSKFQNGQCFQYIQCWTDIAQFMDIAALTQAVPIEDLVQFKEEINSDIPDLTELSANLPDLTDLMSFTSLLYTQDMDMDMDFDIDIESELNTLQQSVADIDFGALFEINSDLVMTGYDATQCVEYVSLSYGSAMAEYILYNETLSVINKLKDEVYNISQTYDLMFMVGVDIQNVFGNITNVMSPLLAQFNHMIDNYARCGFLGEIYGDFKQITCVYVFEDMYRITKAMCIISFLSVIAVLLALCTQYLFHPVTRIVTYRNMYGGGDIADDDDDDDDVIECPRCHYIFSPSQAIDADADRMIVIQTMDDDEYKEEAVGNIDGDVEIDEEYKSMIIMAFYTFAGYLPWAKYSGLYMSGQELARFLEIVCSDERVEDVFSLFDTDINGRITFNEWMDYFTNTNFNKKCIQMKQEIENQITWKLLVKALKIFQEMDTNHSGKLEYHEFVHFGQLIALNEDEIETLFKQMDTNNSESIDITELFEWFRLRLYMQRQRISTTRIAKIQLNDNNGDDDSNHDLLLP